MSAGVRIQFTTDSTVIGGIVAPTEDPAALCPVDLEVDGTVVQSAAIDADGAFTFDRIDAGNKAVQLWLPQFGDFRLASLTVDGSASIQPPGPHSQPRLVVYGSSITQCRTAASPTRTWPAILARHLGLDLTCLGFAGECHLDPMVARMIRDLPADLIVTCLGINVYDAGTFTERSFLPAVLGFLATVREGHVGTPIVVISPIVSPSRESLPGRGGLTLQQVREQVGQAVRLLRDHGDNDLYLLHGTDVLGSKEADLLADGVHPSAKGYEFMAQRITHFVTDVVEPTRGAAAAP